MFKIKRYRKGLYCVEFEKQYDLAMTFVRYQEFYESESTMFRNEFFPLHEFIRYYAFKHGKGAFTYPKDFNGFNIPGHFIGMVAETLLKDKYDFCTAYDFIMFKILNTILKQNKSWDFYLIGVCKKGDKATLKHEIVHGLYYLNGEYKEEVLKLIYSLPKQVRKLMYTKLRKVGYGDNVLNDELNAYMSTGLRKEMKYQFVQKEQQKFKKLYKRYF